MPCRLTTTGPSRRSPRPGFGSFVSEDFESSVHMAKGVRVWQHFAHTAEPHAALQAAIGFRPHLIFLDLRSHVDAAIAFATSVRTRTAFDNVIIIGLADQQPK